MTDRELLELAAKASGLEIVSWVKGCPRINVGFPTSWNPLADDGDAMRLSIVLDFMISFDFEAFGKVSVVSRRAGVFVTEGDRPDGRSYATRRAIVRAAAEIGRAMQ